MAVSATTARLARRANIWAFAIDAIALYPLYALLFTDHGMSQAAVSALFIVWAVVGLAAEVPTGAIADRVSRRGLLTAAGLLQAAAFACWTLWPQPASFVIGFCLWGVSGAFISGTLEALLYDGLAAHGDADRYAHVRGRVAAWGMVGQVPAGLAAGPLYTWGGYTLVGAVSIAASVVAAAAAWALPDTGDPAADADDDYFALVRAGVREAATHAAVRGAVIASAGLLSLEALEEYDVLLARDWGVSTPWVPLAVVGLPLAGAAGAALAGRISTASAPQLAAALAVGVAAVAAAGLARQPWGIPAIAVFYGIFRAVRTVVDLRVQQRITGPARATVTSTAEFGGGLLGVVAFGLWALAGLWGILALAAVVVATLPWSLRPRNR